MHGSISDLPMITELSWLETKCFSLFLSRLFTHWQTEIATHGPITSIPDIPWLQCVVRYIKIYIFISLFTAIKKGCCQFLNRFSLPSSSVRTMLWNVHNEPVHRMDSLNTSGVPSVLDKNYISKFYIIKHSSAWTVPHFKDRNIRWCADMELLNANILHASI